MNERIRELAEQARYYIDPDFDIEFEVFAKLIVEECANIAYKVGLHRQTKHEILRRFGLEVTDEN